MITDTYRKFLILFLTAGFIVNCGEKSPLPSVQYSPDSFGANDTSYIHLTPDWDAASIGYDGANPMLVVDMAIGIDGFIFISDSANDRIFVLDESGNLVKNNNMDKIFPIQNPVGIDIDEKLNLLIVNNTNKIYVWNQYLNIVGIDSVLTFSEQFPDGHFINDAVKIDSLLGISVFYEDEDPNARFNSIVFGPKQDNLVYATDSQNNRIVEIGLVTTGAVKLKNRFPHRIFSGLYIQNISEEGSGAGTVDAPTGITCDADGAVYFTQTGGNFKVQKLVKSGSKFLSAFILYEDDIMDLERFAGPSDIALDPDNDIFVVDAADSGKVSKFVNHGVSSGSAGDLGKEGLSLARFKNPRCIAISEDGVVYIANTFANRIERYRYTISDDDIPDEER